MLEEEDAEEEKFLQKFGSHWIGTCFLFIFMIYVLFVTFLPFYYSLADGISHFLEGKDEESDDPSIRSFTTGIQDCFRIQPDVFTLRRNESIEIEVRFVVFALLSRSL